MSREKFKRATRTPVVIGNIEVQASSVLTVETDGEGFIDITAEVMAFVLDVSGAAGMVTLFIRHTSASLTIQENADPDVLRDLTTALHKLAPRHDGWIHRTEGPDDMPAHIRTMLTATSLQIPVVKCQMALGRWQGIYLVEHRDRPHRREVVLSFAGTRR